MKDRSWNDFVGLKVLVTKGNHKGYYGMLREVGSKECAMVELEASATVGGKLMDYSVQTLYYQL